MCVCVCDIILLCLISHRPMRDDFPTNLFVGLNSNNDYYYCKQPTLPSLQNDSSAKPFELANAATSQAISLQCERNTVISNYFIIIKFHSRYKSLYIYKHIIYCPIKDNFLLKLTMLIDIILFFLYLSFLLTLFFIF